MYMESTWAAKHCVHSISIRKSIIDQLPWWWPVLHSSTHNQTYCTERTKLCLAVMGVAWVSRMLHLAKTKGLKQGFEIAHLFNSGEFSVVCAVFYRNLGTFWSIEFTMAKKKRGKSNFYTNFPACAYQTHKKNQRPCIFLKGCLSPVHWL